MQKFEKTFTKVLHEDTPVQTGSQPPAGQEAQLDPSSITSDPSAYFKEPGEADQFKNGPYPDRINPDKENLEKANQWIAELHDFAEKINGTNTDSLNKIFNKIDKKDSIFSGISSHSRTLVQIAGDLVALAETIRGFIHSSTKPKDVEHK